MRLLSKEHGDWVKDGLELVINMNLTDFKSYKIAKSAIKDLEDALHLINIALSGLKLHKKYKPVQGAIMDLQNHKQIIESYLQRCRDVVESKKI